MIRNSLANTVGCRQTRPNKDTITISFDRFHILRSIAYIVKGGVTGIHDRDRLDKLLKKLKVLEAREVVGILSNT